MRDLIEFGGLRTPGDMKEQFFHPFSGLRGNWPETAEYAQTNGVRQTVTDIFDPTKNPLHLNYIDTWRVGSNELTWMTRHAFVSARVEVTAQGRIQIAYTLTDVLDLRSRSNGTDIYNTISTGLGVLYHDILGGNDQLKVRATWVTVKSP